MRLRIPRAARRRAVLGAASAAALLALLLVGCTNDSDESGPTLSVQAMPDFTLQDVNAASPTGGTSVSVRSYLGEVSAWYFAHAT